MENSIKVILPAISRNEALARSIVAFFAVELDPTIDELGDIKDRRQRSGHELYRARLSRRQTGRHRDIRGHTRRRHTYRNIRQRRRHSGHRSRAPPVFHDGAGRRAFRNGFYHYGDVYGSACGGKPRGRRAQSHYGKVAAEKNRSAVGGCFSRMKPKI